MSIIYTFLDTILPFDWLSYDFMKNDFLAVLLITPLYGMLGTMAVNNKMAFFSDALGHSALTGIALGVVLGIDNTTLSLIAFGVLVALGVTKVKNTRSVPADTVIGVFSSTAVALGLVVLSYGGGFSKYTSYLVGDILSVTPGELLSLLAVLLAVTAVWGAVYNRLLLLSVNRELAASRGVRIILIENIFVVLVAVVVMLSIRQIGILLINSLLVLPAAAARNISKGSRAYLLISVIIALFSGITGLILSFYLNSAAGASIVLVSAAVFTATYLLRKK